MMNFSGAELVIILFLGLVLIGPERMPHYAQQIAKFVKTLRQMMAGAKTTLKEELGDDYAELAKFDPRQYDPRRIVRDALLEDVVPASRQAPSSAQRMAAPMPAPPVAQAASAEEGSEVGDPQAIPFDDEAT